MYSCISKVRPLCLSATAPAESQILQTRPPSRVFHGAERSATRSSADGPACTQKGHNSVDVICCAEANCAQEWLSWRLQRVETESVSRSY